MLTAGGRNNILVYVSSGISVVRVVDHATGAAPNIIGWLCVRPLRYLIYKRHTLAMLMRALIGLPQDL